MIEVNKLTKRYPGRTAIDQISFEVGKGEIVGFLGPNGAGKSTTLRILTCYLSATSGSAKVAGHDIFRESIEVRRRVGYMPESVPLYTDMRVSEYILFRARLKGLRGQDVKRNSEEVMDVCGLKEVGRSMIGTLSKGFRQRVGLADALINKPDLLILDEPTSGLDPNQIRQVRDLITQLGEKHTILISTHILPEVEMTCGRVIIIDGGHIKASDTPQNLVRRLRASGNVRVELQAPPDKARDALKRLPGVKDAVLLETRQDWYTLEVTTESNTDVREDIHALVLRRKWPLRELYRKAASLEDAFVNLTQTPTAD